MVIRRETPEDVEAIREVTAAAFARGGKPDEGPVEASLVDDLRASVAWLPALSLVAIGPDEAVVGHVVCSRGRVGPVPVLALGPLSVHPDHQRRGVGLALMHTVVGAGDALGEPLVVLLGDPRYYSRFGFRLAEEYNIVPPVAGWRPHFQVRILASYEPSIFGTFAYPEPFDRV